MFVSSEMGSLHHLACGDHPMGELPLLLASDVSKAALNGIASHYAKAVTGTPMLVNAVTPAGDPTGAFLASDGADGVTTVPW